MKNQSAPKRAQLAKLTRPRLHASVPRARLWELLDTRRGSPSIWVTGPPGSGKSTLVSSYLSDQRRPTCWFLADEGDQDAASLFYYLVELSRQLGRSKAPPLPYLTPEYLGNVPGFARRFFRDFYSMLPVGGVLVLDNCHEASSPLFHQILREAVAEVPVGRSLYLISRELPPPELAAARTRERLRVLEGEALKLSSQEAQDIAAVRTDHHLEQIDLMNRKVDGWVTGLVLLLENRSEGPGSGSLDRMTHEGIFEYFAGEILDRTTRDVRDVLISTSLVPDLTPATAVALSENPEAERVLERLYRSHYFVHRRAEGGLRYQYHDLFRHFLRRQFDDGYTTQVKAHKLSLAARLMEAESRPADALELWARRGEWAQIARIIQAHASDLMAGGRWQTLNGWLDRLPASEIAASAWLCYWRATATAARNPEDALRWFEEACTLFGRHGEAQGELHCAAGALFTIYASGRSQSRTDTWIPVVRRTLHLAGRIEDVNVRARVLTMISFVGPFWTQRKALRNALWPPIDELWAHPDLSSTSRAWLSAVLAQFAYTDSNAVLLGKLEHSFDDIFSPEPTDPMAAVVSLGWYGMMLIPFDQLPRSDELFQRVLSIAQQRGLDGIVAYAGSMRTIIRAVLDDPDCAIDNARLAREALRDGEGVAMTQILHGEYLVAARTGQTDLALQLHQAVESHCEKSGAHSIRCIQRLHHIDLLVEIGQLEEADRLLQFVDQTILTWRIQCFDAELAVVRTSLALKTRGWAAAQASLDQVLALAQEPGQLGHLRFAPHSTRSVFCAALERGHETERVSRLVRALDLTPPADAPDQWPWAVSVLTLGRFEVHVNGLPLRFSTKQPRKPLALLRALTAGRAGEPIRQSTLVDQLWPDLDGDAADKAFRMALMRLRALLGRSEAIVHAAGQLMLDPRWVWIDAQAFMRHARRHQEQGLAEDFHRACELYRGAFLPGDQDLMLTFDQRERVRQMFLEMIDRHGTEAELGKRWEQALEIYGRGIEADDLVESFHQGRIRCLQAIGRAGEVGGALAQLRRAFARKLGIGPSPETLALASRGRDAA